MDVQLYTPGAGHIPPELVGRDALVDDWRLMLNGLTSQGRVAAEDMVLTGPRGVGKTTMLTAYGEAAREQGFEVVDLQATRHHASVVDSLVSEASTRLEDGAGVWTRARSALERLSGISLSVAGISLGVNTRDSQDTPRPSQLQDPGALARALATIAGAVVEDRGRGGLLITIDELQAAHPSDLTLIAGALHRLNVNHPRATVAFAASGLPQTTDVLIDAGVTHPDRLFAEESIPLTLTPQQTELAIALPAQRQGVSWHPDALQLVTSATNGFPAHVQLFADAIWQRAPGPHDITLQDAQVGITAAADQINRRTLRPRWDRMPDLAMEYLTALALHEGHATTKQMTETLGKSASTLSKTRDRLLDEGDIYAPRRGQVVMSMPLLAPYALARYEESRAYVGTEILSLDQMRANRNAARDISPLPPASPASAGRRHERSLPPSARGLEGPSR